MLPRCFARSTFDEATTYVSVQTSVVRQSGQTTGTPWHGNRHVAWGKVTFSISSTSRVVSTIVRSHNT
eukprot:4145424-Prymnesium_polylepis.1